MFMKERYFTKNGKREIEKKAVISREVGVKPVRKLHGAAESFPSLQLKGEM